MKTKLLLIAFLVFGITINAQETTANVSMGPNYEKQVYYKLSAETENTYAANSWDVAFLRVSSFEVGIRVNAHLGIEVFEASNNPGDWGSIDLADEGSWPMLYNSNLEWDLGAFMQGSAEYGWGEYNPVTHHVEGTIIFVLKYPNGTYVKFINEEFYNGYTFKYATWDGSSWSADTTYTLPNTNNPDNRYNYYSLQNDTEVVAEPADMDWDFMFTKYWDVIQSQYYLVTGVMQSTHVTVAKNIESTGDPLPYNPPYFEAINTIGYDWKSFDETNYVVNSDMKYYVKYEDGTIYRMYFTEFEGSATGNIEFMFSDVTVEMDITDLSNQVSFGVYPNPVVNDQLNIIYDVKNTLSDDLKLNIYSLSGRQVFNQNLKNTTGFYNQQIDLPNLQSGIYMLQLRSNDSVVSKKIIVE
jgi:hypothetical protein